MEKRETLESACDDLIKLPEKRSSSSINGPKPLMSFWEITTLDTSRWLPMSSIAKSVSFLWNMKDEKLRGNKTLKVISHSSAKNFLVLRRKKVFLA